MNTVSSNSSAVVLCPGQGAQQIGMGKIWAEQYPIAAETFAEADRILGFALSRLCFEGPQDQLDRTDNAQPALYVTAVACWRALRSQEQPPSMHVTAGLSLGEFTALHLAGAFDFETGLKLVRLRGQAMQEAAEASSGGMVALIGADEAKARELCAQALGKVCGNDEVLVPANFNCPGQIVLSGTKAACQQALDLARELNVMAKPLAVAGAFHSSLMRPAAERLGEALSRIAWKRPGFTVLSNVTGAPHNGEDHDTITRLLVRQLTDPVQWMQCMQWIVAHAPQPNYTYLELAPNTVLAGLARRLDRKLKVESCDQPAKGAAA